MKLTTIFSAVIASACLANAVPVEDVSKRELNLGGLFGPIGSLVGGNGLGAAGQDITAEAFKLGDAILNIPGDAISNFLSGNPGASFRDVIKFVASLPGDAGKIGKDLFSGGKN